jgi:hypothetical protein
MGFLPFLLIAAGIVWLLAREAAISAAVDTIHGMRTPGARADPEILSLRSLEVAAWAHRAGLAQTAIEFAQAGATAAPEFGEAALSSTLKMGIQSTAPMAEFQTCRHKKAQAVLAHDLG